MNIAQSGGSPIESRAQLVAYLEQGAKPSSDWAIGTEHEKFGFRLDDHRPLPYEGERGVRALLEGLQRFGWQPMMEGDTLIGLKQGGATVTLEPGGQFELSGAPLKNLHQTCSEVNTHLDQVRQVAGELNLGFLGLGFSPKWRLDETPIMPKQRYTIMREYMPTRGALGLDMMFRSCTVQVNLDFSNEADMRKKFRVGLALQPIVTALFANSPFTEGRPNGFLSYRSEVWRDTDPDRSGMLPFVFEDGFGFERYVDYALDVPMYFVYREGKYVDVSGHSFRDFLDGTLTGFVGELPTMNDWVDHLTTIFPEVRLKQFLEMRGADGGPWGRLCALPALWTGLMYDGTSLDAAWDMVKDWDAEERQTLRDAVPRTALHTPFRGATVHKFAQEMLAIARNGLKSRGVAGREDPDETEYLAELDEIIDKGRTPAEDLLALYQGAWKGDIDRIFDECAY